MLRDPGHTPVSGVESAGLGSRSKPHIFVAMQFGPETDDLFHYGIQAAVKANDFLCERIDTVSFTGDILSQIKARIDSASLVIASHERSSNSSWHYDLGMPRDWRPTTAGLTLWGEPEPDVQAISLRGNVPKVLTS
jgi:hypothetical protein